MSIYTKIHQVMQRVEKVRKDLENQHHKYKYIGHDDVTIALRTAFAEVGLVQTVTILEAMRLDGGSLGVRVGIKWTDVEDNSAVEVESYGESASGGKGGPQPQMVGIALSYAVKCAQLKNFCLVGDDTPDVEEQHGPTETARDVSRTPPAPWQLAGNGKSDDPPAPSEPPAPVETQPSDLDQMLAGFDAVTSLKRFDQMMKRCVPLLSGLSSEERQQLEKVALRARKRLTSAEKEVEESR